LDHGGKRQVSSGKKDLSGGADQEKVPKTDEEDLYVPFKKKKEKPWK